MNEIISLALLVLWVAAVAAALKPVRREQCGEMMPLMVLDSVGVDSAGVDAVRVGPGTGGRR